jgi:hypothetical protein
MYQERKEGYWYDYVNINSILKNLNNDDRDYLIVEATSQDNLHISQTVNQALTQLSKKPNIGSAVVIPINLGNIIDGKYKGSHWVGLVIRYTAELSLEAFYNDSFGTPMDISLPALRQILKNHEVNRITDFQYRQQFNGYDCGPWTVFNLDSMARNGRLPESIQGEDIINQRLSIEPSITNIKISNTDPLAEEANGMCESKEDKEFSELVERTEKISLNSLPEKDFSLLRIHGSSFVISTIAHVPEYKFDDDSSDEEDDGTFSDELFNFDVNSKDSFPFTTNVPKYGRKKSNDFRELSSPKKIYTKSLVVGPFVQKLIENAFEEADKSNLPNSIAVSIGLNRMVSLSARKNKSLLLELKSDVGKEVKCEKFGFFWKCNWYNAKGQPVKYRLVKKFYKQLKKIDSEKAKNFIKATESSVAVPYQELREYAKNHTKAKTLIKEFREKSPNADIYLSLIDSDTISFNGIYSAYLRILKHSTPTVMSTGYEFPANREGYGNVYQLASQLDRMIRVMTTRHIPLGVYYPEPNTCVLIPKDCDTISESFIDESFKKGDLESASLLRKVKNKANATFVFSDDKPLITTIPHRAKFTKVHKTPISFSVESTKGASPTKSDIRSFKQITQSHFHEKVWYDNLFINQAIMVKGCSIAHCKSLLAKIRNGDNKNKEQAILELKNYINSQTVDAIVKAAEEVNSYIHNFEIEYVRSEDETRLLEILKEYDIDISNFSRDVLLILSQDDVLDMIEQEIIHPKDFIGLSVGILREIFYNEEIIEMLENESITFVELLNLYSIVKLHKQEFLEVLQQFISAINKGEYSNKEILERYEEDPLHLEYMAGDPYDVFLQNIENANKELYQFVLENGYLDEDNMQDIRCDLNETQLMDFDRAIGVNEEFDVTESNYDFSSEFFDETW